jgi:dihydroorotase
MGLPTGRVAPGHRGHLIVVDFKEQQRIQAARLHAPCGWTPFEGFPAVFPAEHYHDGELIVDHGEYVGRLSGKVVRPEYAPGARSLPAPDD